MTGMRGKRGKGLEAERMGRTGRGLGRSGWEENGKGLEPERMGEEWKDAWAGTDGERAGRRMGKNIWGKGGKGSYKNG